MYSNKYSICTALGWLGPSQGFPVQIKRTEHFDFGKLPDISMEYFGVSFAMLTIKISNANQLI